MAVDQGSRTPRGTSEEQRFAEAYPQVRRFAAAVGPPDVEPDDLVQEALARALRRGPLDDIDDLGAYLRTIVLNLSRNHRRSWVRATRAMSAMRVRAETTDTYPSDLADLMRLNPETRAVLYLVEVEGRTFDDVARTLGLTPEAARARASRARHTLRDAIGAELAPCLEELT